MKVTMTATTQPRHTPSAPVPGRHGVTDSDELKPRAGFDEATAVSGINVLVIVGSRARSVGAQLIRLAAESSPHGIRVRVFAGLADLPACSPAICQRIPDCVVELLAAADEAQAALLLTPYRGRVDAMVHNAIEWLTVGLNRSSLHDKPVAVIGPSADCYSGVWSHHQSSADGWGPGPRIVEPITVPTLAEAVRKLAGEVTSACAGPPSAPTPDVGN